MKRYQPRLRLTIAEQRLLRDIFTIAVSNYQYDGEDIKEQQASQLFTKIVSKA